MWNELDMSMYDPHLFQYTYEGETTSATATAIGDLDCDGTTIKYTLRMTAKEGVVSSEIEEPPPNTD